MVQKAFGLGAIYAVYFITNITKDSSTSSWLGLGRSKCILQLSAHVKLIVGRL